MTTKKMSKKQIIDELQIILNTLWCDSECIDQDIIDNQFYFNDGDYQMCDASRAYALRAKRDIEHIAKRLQQILDEV